MIEYNKKNARSWSIMGINPSIWSVGFPEALEKDIENTYLLTADLGRYSGLTRTASIHPEIFYNVGIAEQNMVGIAGGLALHGKRVYMTTYAPFMTLRCADQIRHFMGNLNLPLVAVGSASGMSARSSGDALTCINDIALMRTVPNVVVLSPADCAEAIKMMEAIPDLNAPVYMRFCGAVNIPIVYTEDYNFKIGKAVMLKKGKKAAIIATGTNMVSESLKAAKLIEEKLGFSPTVIDMHTIKPIDLECITELAQTHDVVATVEEHSIIGGLGGAVSEALAKINHSSRQIFLGVGDRTYKAGSRAFCLEQCGLTAQGIADRVESALNKNILGGLYD